jgi:hypothetical protein
VSDHRELDRVRSVGLSPYDINVLSTMMETGGEFPFYIDRVEPEMRDIHIAGMSSLANRGLIAVDEARSTTDRWILRLTDNGRAVCAQLEKMRVKPQVEVQMHGDTPEVIKP